MYIYFGTIWSYIKDEADSTDSVHALLISHARPVLSLCMSSPKLVYAPPKSVVCPA